MASRGEACQLTIAMSKDRPWELRSLPETKKQQPGFIFRVLRDMNLDILYGISTEVTLAKLVEIIAQINIKDGLSHDEMLVNILDLFSLSQASTVTQVKYNTVPVSPIRLEEPQAGFSNELILAFQTIRTGFDQHLQRLSLSPRLSYKANFALIEYLSNRGLEPMSTTGLSTGNK